MPPCRTLRLGLALLLQVGFLSAAWADGQRDLEDGIAFYDNLDLDRARARLTAASEASDLPREGRARALLYLGMLDFELGEREAAERAWLKAFGLAPELEAPKGTSPKTIAAMDAVRARAEPLPPEPAPTPAPAPPPPASPPPPTVAAPPPSVTPPPPPPPALVTTPPPADADDEGTSPWVWVGVGAGVAATAAAVTLAILLTGGSDSACEGDAGGCLRVVLP